MYLCYVIISMLPIFGVLFPVLMRTDLVHVLLTIFLCAYVNINLQVLYPGYLFPLIVITQIYVYGFNNRVKLT